MLMYGSILIEVIFSPLAFNTEPILDAKMPLPIPLITPPVMRMYFIWLVVDEEMLEVRES